MFLLCPARWYATYRRGLKMSGLYLKLGSMVHRGLQHLHQAAGLAGRGADHADVVELSERYLLDAGDLTWYKKLTVAFERYAERLGGELPGKLVGTEHPVQAYVTVKVPGGPLKVLVRGVIDLDMENSNEEPLTREFKLVGQIPSRSELEDDLQTSMYAWMKRAERSVRDGRSYLGLVWKEWASVLLGIVVGPVVSDVKDAEVTEQFVREKVQQMVDAVRAEKYPEVVNRRCGSCPVIGDCKAWRRERKTFGLERLVPTLPEVERWRQRVAVMSEALDRLREGARDRTARAGGELIEDGFRAEITHSEGGLPEKYQGFTTVAQFREELTREGGSTLRIRPVGKAPR